MYSAKKIVCVGWVWTLIVGAAACRSLFGQEIAPSVEWEQFYQGSACNVLAVVESGDGGYLLGGLIYDVGMEGSSNDCILVRVGTQGEILWDKVYGGVESDSIVSLVRTDDGGYVFAAVSQSPISGSKGAEHFGQVDVWIVSVDAEGAKRWERSFGGTGDDWLHSIAKTMDGGLLLAGVSTSPPSGNKETELLGVADGWLLKIDAQGDKQWERSFGGEGGDGFYSVRQTADGGCVVVGSSYSLPSGNKDAVHFGGGDGWLVKVDADGAKEWERSYGGSGDDQLFSIDQAADGGFILGGGSSSPPSGNKESAHFGGVDGWLVKVDADGAKEWDQSYGTSDRDESVKAVRRADEGGYVFWAAGWTGLPGTRLVKVDPLGSQQWEQAFEVAGSVISYRIEIRDLYSTGDGGFIVSGNYHDPLAGVPGFGCVGGAWVMKLERVVSGAGKVVTWDAGEGAVLESADSLHNEWSADQSEVLSVGEASAIHLVPSPSGEQRFYRLRSDGSSSAVSRLELGSLLTWAADQNQTLEVSASGDGDWIEFSGEQGIIGESHYAIVPRSLKRHYFRTRKME